MKNNYSIREYAINSITNRNNFASKEYVSELFGTNESFQSLYLHTEDIKSYAEANRTIRGKVSVAGYSGAVYTDELLLDLDVKDNLETAFSVLKKFITHLNTNYSINPDDLKYRFSGSKGFHIIIPAELFGGFTPSEDLPKLQSLITKALTTGFEEYFDHSIYQCTRLVRIPGTKHSKTGLFSIMLTYNEILGSTVDEIKKFAEQPCQPVSVNGGTLEVNPKLEENKRSSLVALTNYTKPETSTGFNFKALDALIISKWDRMEQHCKVLTGIKIKSYSGENINNKERVFLGTLAMAFGDSGREKVHELLSSQSNYNRDVTENNLRSMDKAVYKPELCLTICGAANICSKIKAINKRSPIAFAYTPDLSDESDIKFNETDACDRIVSNYDNLIYSVPDHSFYLYRNGVYQKQEDEDVRTIANSLLPFYVPDNQLTNTRLTGVVERLKIIDEIRYTGTFNQDMFKINLQNGIFDMRTRTLEPHRRDFYSTIQLPFVYNEHATCPLFTKVLGEIFSNNQEVIDYWLQWFCYLLLPSYDFQKVLVLYGTGRNGKGVLIRVITNMLGKENVSNLDIHDLSTSEFKVIHLKDKLVNFSSDLRISGDIDLSMVKQLSGGDLISANVKFKPILNFKNVARLVISTNRIPRLTELNNAVLERFEFFKFLNQFNGDKADTSLDKKLIKEMPGIFNIVTSKLYKIIKTDGNIYFEAPPTIRRFKNEIKSTLHSVAEFLDENYVIHKDYNLVLKDVYFDYKEWCENSGYHPVGKQNFQDVLKTGGYGLKIDYNTKNHNKKTVYGLKMRDN
jgi:putative DNA primase/helicase